MLNSVVRYLSCPHCGGPLEADGRTLRCPAGHGFDVARQGYVSLLARQAGANADTKEMVEARAAFLGAGHYAPLAAALARLARTVTDPGVPGCVADVGGGTGYYQAHVMDELPGRDGVLLDLSKFAARRAAKAHARIGAVVADAWRPLPLRDGSAALVLNTFAPRNGPELRRVLNPGGTLLVVTPRTDHLAELVGPLGLMRVDERKEERLAGQLAPHFAVTASERLTTAMVLDHEALGLLVGMGPNAHHQDGEDLRRRVARLPERCDVTLSVTLTAYRPLR
ncbi:ubiquinone biosynthesis protein [Streptomyces mashuensis]|uniref:Ubiquinone biosynthesis protein n=1 Tax=Streptomyces mashuensis TaxID=33904 RepID=A0A919ATV9_9ACTN|nr:methyltransferase domain-containing protein [Streptomyces mashuensis]GHF24746.1 ubiquinone biosynthesis protein [Streptomyces mashuensis]